MNASTTIGSFITLAQSPPTLPGAPAGTPASTGTATTGTAPATGAGPATQGDPMSMIWIFGLVMVAMIVFTSFSGRKQKKQREQLLAGVKRGDRVVTTSGIVGTIADLYDTEMVLRVDEASNTRIRFQRSALQNILREGKDGGASGSLESKPKAEPVGAAN
jgi:preprotein translocase subunit YajC